MYAAATAGFAGADVDIAFKRHQSFYLRAGEGAFACNLILGKLKNGGQAVYARAKTWLHASTPSMLDGQRVPLPPASSPERSIAALLLRLARENSAGKAVTRPAVKWESDRSNNLPSPVA